MKFHRGSTGIVLALTAVVLLSCAGARKYAGMGYDLMGEGKYRAALELFDKSLEEDSTTYALMGKAECEVKLKGFPGAIAAYSVVIGGGGPDAGRARALRGLAYAQMGHHQRAVDDYTACVNGGNPGFDLARLYYRRARSSTAMRRYDAALADCQRAIDRDGSRGEYYELRGDVFCEMGDARGARDNYTHANEKFARARSTRGVERMRGKLARPCAAAGSAQHAAVPPPPGGRYMVDAADPQMRLIGEYLLLNPVQRQIEVMTSMLVSGLPQWKQDAYRKAVAAMGSDRVEHMLVQLLMHDLTFSELQILVEMARLEKSTNPSDKSRLEGYRESYYAGGLRTKEDSCYNRLRQYFEREIQRTCRAMGLGC